MKKTVCWVFCTFVLSGCNMVRMMNETTAAIECNRRAVEKSTCAIQQNVRAVEESTRAIEENKRKVDAINHSLTEMGGP